MVHIHKVFWGRRFTLTWWGKMLSFMGGSSESGFHPRLEKTRARVFGPDPMIILMSEGDTDPIPDNCVTPEQWEVIRRTRQEKKPVWYWLLETAPTWIDDQMARINRGAWWVIHRLHPGYRHHVINTGLSPNYYDIDTLMLYANMALLCRYVEDEMGGMDQVVERRHFLIQKNVIEEANQLQQIILIYEWWVHYRKLDSLVREERFKEEDEMLQKLIPLRHTMWT